MLKDHVKCTAFHRAQRTTTLYFDRRFSLSDGKPFLNVGFSKVSLLRFQRNDSYKVGGEARCVYKSAAVAIQSGGS